MPRLHRAIGWSLVGLGGIHVLATPLFEPGFSEASVWFGSAGAALMLVGALNVLSLDQRALPSLRGLARAANLGTAALAVALVATSPAAARETFAGSLSARLGDPQVFLVLALALGAFWLSRSGGGLVPRPPA